MVILAATLALTPSETKSATIDLVDSNGRIAFVGYSSSHAPAQLYVVNSNGSGLKPLANVDGFTSDDRIAWSPDGQKIAVPRAGRANGLYIVKVNGSGQTKLVSDADWPAWSPDGKKIAFARPGGIYVINTDGSGLRRLIANHGRPSVSYYSAPSWSPDGTKIAFGWYGNCRAPGGPTFGCSKIEIASSDGSSTKTLIEGCPPDCATTNPPPPDMRGEIADPAWSPDGAKIAFRWDWCACTPRGRDSVLLEIGVVNSNGSGVKRLTAVQPPVANWQPAWSPDGTKIVFGKVPCFPKALCFPHEGYAGSTLYVMNASGSNQHKLVGGLDSAFAPAWQPSGERPVPVPSSLSLAPRSQTNDPGAHATVTATVVDDNGKAVPGVTVYFAVTMGPNVGTTGSAETDGHGRASFSYTSSTTGIDTLSASFVDHGGNVHRGNSVTITWQIGTPPPTCSTSSLTFGPTSVGAACFTEVGNGRWTASDRIRLGGLDIVPSGAITVDQHALRITAKGDVDVQLNALGETVTLYHGALEWSFDASLRIDIHINVASEVEGFPIEGQPTARCKDGTYSYSRNRSGTCSHHGGVAVWNPRSSDLLDATASIELTAEGVTIGAKVDLPDALGGVSADVALHATRDQGLKLDELRVTAGGFMLGPLQASDLSLSYDGATDRWTGEATVAFTSRIPFTIHGVVTVSHGSFESAVADVSGINQLIADGVYLQRLRFGIALDPFSLSGGMGVSAGPEILGAEAVSLDGDMTYTDGNPSTFTIRGNLKLVSQQLANAQIDYRTNGQADFKGELNFTNSGFGFHAMIGGSINGASSFQANGNGGLEAFGHDLLGADGIVSSNGLAACAHLALWDVGFGYYWNGNFSPMASSCDVGPWRIASSFASSFYASQFTPSVLAEPAEITLPPGLPGDVFAAVGATAPPKVVITGPTGQTITTPAETNAVVTTGSVLLIEDPIDNTTYVAIAKPAAGRWKITALPVSSPLIQVREAAGLRPPVVHARVSGRGSRRLLRWQLIPRPGQQVSFYEQGRGITKLLVATDRARGSIYFSPTDGPTRSRAIVAFIQQSGLARRILTVAHYAAPKPLVPGAPQHLRVSRHGATLTIRWGPASGAASYRVEISLLDGRQLLFFRRANARSILVGELTRYDPGAVQITGVSTNGREGPTARAKIRARA